MPREHGRMLLLVEFVWEDDYCTSAQAVKSIATGIEKLGTIETDVNVIGAYPFMEEQIK